MQTVTIGASTQGAAQLVAAGDGPTLISNADPANTVYLGDNPSFTIGIDAVPLAPTQFVAVDGQHDVYGETGQGQTATVYLIPGGISFFQLLRRLIIEADIASSGLFVYSGAPALSDLIASIAAVTETDTFGNVVDAGLSSYEAGASGRVANLANGAIRLGVPSQFAALSGSGPAILFVNGGIANELTMLTGTTSSGDTSASIELFSSSATNSFPSITLSGLVSISEKSGPVVPFESWNTISLDARLTGALAGGIGIRVKRVPWSGVWIDCDVSAADIGTFTCGSLPSADYYPTTARHFALGANGGSLARLFIPTSGALQIIVGGSGAWAGGVSTVYPQD